MRIIINKPRTSSPLVPRLEGRGAGGEGCSHARGFTLSELLVVIFIILLLTLMALPAVLGGMRDRRLGEAIRSIEGILAGARDRAIVSGKPCGVRFLRDERDPWNCSRVVYVATPDVYSVGVVNVAGTLVTPAGVLDPHFEQVDPGKDNRLGAPYDADDIPRVVWGRSLIRFNQTGPILVVAGVTAGPPATLTLAQPSPITGGPFPYQLIGPPVPRAQDSIQNLPEGIVIDLRFAPITPAHALAPDPLINVPRSWGLPNQVPPDGPGLRGADGIFGNSDDPSPQTWPPIEVLFSPNGSVLLGNGTSSIVHIWVCEQADKGPNPVASCGPDGIPGTPDDVGPARPRALLTLNTRTGAVDVLQNPTSAGTLARAYSEIYAPAQQVLGVSQLP
jgi:prepilin-type N-terminal cleavage/methylation domain-containing protein